MPFKGILKSLTEKMDGRGAIMLDWEGEAVESFSLDDSLELAALGAHKGIILAMLQQAAERHVTKGDIQNVGISTANLKIAITVIKDGYYILLAMDKRKPFGRAFFESRRAVEKLMKEMY